MQKITVYGLPLNPRHLLAQLAGESFCVSYGTRDKLGAQLAQAIELVGDRTDSILLVDNGAYGAHCAGEDTTGEAYLAGFCQWANEITAQCDSAIVVLPDVIGGTAEQNWQFACEAMPLLDAGDRMMAVWHLHEPVSYLTHLCESFSYIAFGSSGQYWKIGTREWHARIREAFAAIDAWERAGEGAYVRPRIHMMRAQKFAHLYPFDSSDSCNVARNHSRARKGGSSVRQTARRIDAKIQRSAGAAAPHQRAAQLADLETFPVQIARQLGYDVIYPEPRNFTDTADAPTERSAPPVHQLALNL